MKHPLRDLARDLRTNMTEPERFMWTRIRKKQLAGFRFRRQKPIGNYIVDFVCPEAMLIIELDGGQQASTIDRDTIRTCFLNTMGYRVLRFWNNVVVSEWESVETVIVRALMGEGSSPHPALPPKRGEGKTPRTTENDDAE